MGTKSTIEVAVSDGPFDHDSPLAVAVLKLIYKVRVVRTRDPLLMSQAQMRIGIGRKHDLATGDFDHDQHGAPFRINGVKYATFGLVWRQFGDRICRSKRLAEAVDRLLVQPCDAAHTGNLGRLDQGPNAYSVTSMIESLNPTWMERELDQAVQFAKAVRLAKKILKRAIAACRADIEKADAIQRAVSLTDDVRILSFDTPIPWSLDETGWPPEVRYIVSPDRELWHIRSLTEKVTALTKYPLPDSWAGKFEEDLAALIGLPDAFRCSHDRASAAATSLEGALTMAKLALL